MRDGGGAPDVQPERVEGWGAHGGTTANTRPTRTSHGLTHLSPFSPSFPSSFLLSSLPSPCPPAAKHLDSPSASFIRNSQLFAAVHTRRVSTLVQHLWGGNSPHLREGPLPRSPKSSHRTRPSAPEARAKGPEPTRGGSAGLGRQAPPTLR